MAVEQTPETKARTGLLIASDDTLFVDELLLDRYRVSKTISRSDISIVQLAVDKIDGKNVAIKTLLDPNPEAICLFTQDMLALSTLSHPNLVQFIDYKEPHYVMKFVKGFTLDQLLAKVKAFGKIGDVSRIFDQIIEPMVVAHEHNVVHGYLNPRNILFEKVDDHVVVRLVGFGEAGVRRHVGKETDVGVIPFICPQDRDDYLPTVQSDVYSLGAVMYLALTGKTPPLIVEESMEEFVGGFQALISTKLDNSRYLAVLIHKCMSPDTSERYPDVRSMKRALEMWRQSIRRPKTNPMLKTISDVSSNTLPAKPIMSHSIRDTANLPIVSLESYAEKLKTRLSLESAPDDEMKPGAPYMTPTAVTPTPTAVTPTPTAVTPTPTAVALTPTAVELTPTAAETSPTTAETSPTAAETSSTATVALSARIAEAPAALVGEILGERYVVLELCSQSEVTVVYLANDLSTDEPVAMKTLRCATEEMVRAFAKEVSEIKSLSHPNLVKFLDYHEIDDQPFYMTEFVEGPTFGELLESIGRMETEEQIASAIIQLCDVAEILQANNLYTGNLNPESILLLESDGEVLIKLAGLGTGEVRKLFYDLNPERIDVRSYANLEHYYRVAKSGQTPVYDVGAVAFEMVTGRKPFETYATESLSLGSAEIHMEKITLLRPDLFKVKELNALLERALTPTANQEFTQLADFKTAVKSWIQSTRDELIESLNQNSEITLTGSQARSWHSQKLSNEEFLDKKVGELKSAQIKGEKTLGMLFTKIVSVKGRRESPLYTIFQLILLSVSAVVFIYTTARYVQENHETLRSQYLELAQQVSSQIPIARKSKSTWSIEMTNQLYLYEDDPAYKRWCNNKIVGVARLVESSGNLVDK